MRLRRWLVLVEVVPDPELLTLDRPRIVGPYWTKAGALRVLHRLRREAHGDPRPIDIRAVRLENVHTLLDNPPWWAG